MRQEAIICGRSKIFKRGWAILVGVPALFVLVYLHPYLPWIKDNTLCAVKIAIGVDCPGCGITRSLSHLLHGELVRGIRMHPLGPILLAGLAYLFFKSLAEFVAGCEFPRLLSVESRRLLGFVVLVALIGSWLIRLYIMYVH